MKNILFGLIATILFSFTGNSQSFEKSVSIIQGSRVQIKGNTMTAKSLLIKSFDSKYKLSDNYTIKGVGFTDDGKNYDLKAGDGIYTSTTLFGEPVKTLVGDTRVVYINDSFAYFDALKKYLLTHGGVDNIKIGCKMRIVYTGTTWFGNSCANGCIELYDCEISWEIDLF